MAVHSRIKSLKNNATPSNNLDIPPFFSLKDMMFVIIPIVILIILLFFIIFKK